MTKTRTQLELQLDHLRAVAALLVVIGHTRALFLVPFSEVEHPNLIIKLIYAVTGLGHEAVMIFFVLSGYLVGGSVLRSVRMGRWSWSHYLSRRLTRLYVVLLPALLIGGLLDAAGLYLTGGAGVYDGTVAWVVKAGVLERLSWSTLLGNVGFVQTIVTDTYGSNGPLWSLANEFWYYLLFPLLAIAAFGGRAMSRRLGYGLVAVAVLLFVGKSIALYFSIWCLGVFGYWLAERVNGLRVGTITVASTVAMLSGSLAVSRGRLLDGFAGDLLIGIVTAGFILATVAWRRAPEPTRATPLSGAAHYSYTLYLVHLPLLVLFRGVLEGAWAFTPKQPDWLPLIATTAAVGLVVTYAWLISLVTEARTDQLRGAVTQLTRRSDVTPSEAA